MPNLTLVSAVDTFLGSADQAEMRTNLSLGTMATQAASAVAITGGSISGITSFGLGSISPLFVVWDANTFYTGSGWGVGFRSTVDNVARLWVAKGIGMSATATNNPDVFIQPQSANVLQLGVTGPSPSAQCFKGPNGYGNNIAGGKLSIAPGQSTGNATPAKLALQGTAGGSSGSTAQTLADVLTVVNASYITLGDATVAAVLTIGIAATGLTIGQNSSAALGFWGASPVNQWNTEGTGGIASAGSGTPVLDDSKFTGGAGSLAYTINDIVAALKASGFMAA